MPRRSRVVDPDAERRFDAGAAFVDVDEGTAAG